MRVTTENGDVRISFQTYLIILAAMVAISVLIRLGVNFSHHEPGGVFAGWWYYAIPAIFLSPFEMMFTDSKKTSADESPGFLKRIIGKRATE